VRALDLLCFVFAFCLSLITCGASVAVLKRRGAKQEILHYVKEHSSKSGTPTMGGIGFLPALVACAFAVTDTGSGKLARLCVIITAAFGLIGFLDDFIKIRFKRNLGLRAYQKILAQLFVSVIVGIFVWKDPLIGGEILIPFANTAVDIGFWIFPLTVFVFLACSNGVNLTDGLDGLASSVTLTYLVYFCVLANIEKSNLLAQGQVLLAAEYTNIMRVALCGIGVLAAFLIYNAYPAKIFMGDVGSMALGAFVACLSIFTKMSLYIPVLGIVYVISCISVIAQVVYFKLTKGKRIFLMAPYHHHLQQKGLSEPRICVIYCAITALAGSVLVIFAAV
jgi:phospho-N-acetylmuramoyl-pentapeptide-transferase